MHRNEIVENLVVRVLAVACRADAGALDRQTSMADLAMDSLTLVAVLSQVEAAYGVEFKADETLALMGAEDVGQLVGAIELKVKSLDA
jgi:acyl carrier protein